MLKVYVIDGDAPRRLKICRLLMQRAVHPEPFDSAEEFLEFLPHDGVILAHDRSGQAHDLLTAIEDHSWLPVVMYDEAPTMPRIVGAMQDGAASYISYPFDLDAMAEEYDRLKDSFAVQSAQRRRAGAARKLLDTLSLRERQILSCMLDHGTSKEIARHLGISPRTVEAHRAKLMARLQVKTSSQAIRVAMEGGVYAAGFEPAAVTVVDEEGPVAEAEPAPARRAAGARG